MYTYCELPELVQRPNYPRPSWGTEIFHQLPNISSSIIISTSVDSDGLGLHVIGKSAEILSSCSRSNIQPCAYAGRPNSQAKSWHFILLKKNKLMKSQLGKNNKNGTSPGRATDTLFQLRDPGISSFRFLMPFLYILVGPSQPNLDLPMCFTFKGIQWGTKLG